MNKFSQMLDRIFGNRTNENRTKELKWYSPQVEGLEDRTLLSVAPSDMGQTALISELLSNQTEDALVELPASGAVNAAKTVQADYLDTDGSVKTVSATVVDKTMKGTWEAGWYIVNSNVTIANASITCSGAVNLILADNGSLTIRGAANKAGIGVTGTNSLTIYGQSAGTGLLDVTGGTYSAGIGGGKNEVGQNITINGGTINANGTSYAAGIGGGNNKDGQNITINAGTINASGGSYGAGIGGGSEGTGQNITIKGGTVTTTGGIYGAGIGGGNRSTGEEITISGGTVLAKGGVNGAGIGGGYKNTASNITISGGNVTATSTTASGIGSGKSGTAAQNITISTAMDVVAGDSEETAELIKNSGGDLAESLSGMKYVNAETVKPPVMTETDYINELGQKQTVTAVVVDSTMTDNWTTRWTDGWYVVNSNLTMDKASITCDGNIKLIIADGCSLTVTGAANKAGIEVSGSVNSLTLYGQTNGTGILTATGGTYAAGIGGDMEKAGNNITINGITVIAKGGANGAGIGGGYRGSAQNITVNSGTVTATATITGIGAGRSGSAAQNIIVNKDWTVKAGASEAKAERVKNKGDDLAVSLANQKYVNIQPAKPPVTIETYYINEQGERKTVTAVVVDSTMTEEWTTRWTDGWYVVNSNLTMDKASITCDGNIKLIIADGCSLTVTGAANKAGIEVSGSGNSLTLYGQSGQSGRLTANGGTNAAGIGGNNGETGSNITINGVTVLADGGTNGAGIGGGYRGSAQNITVNSGIVIATSTVTGIGAGRNGSAARNILVNKQWIVKAGANQKDAAVIPNSGSDLTASLSGQKYASIMRGQYIYVDEKGIIRSTDATVVTSSMTGDWSAGWYIVLNNITMSNASVTCQGDVKLILADGTSLTVSGADQKAGINVSGSNRFTVYGQIQGNGKLSATGGEEAAGIGGNDVQEGCNITINGGNITAKGGYKSSGIGGGNRSAGHDITINRGTVTATGGVYGAGIGGGGSYHASKNAGNAQNITINGGTVKATGKNGGAGIGGGGAFWAIPNGGTLDGFLMTGGEVTATGSKKAAGVGGGNDCGVGKNITIKGGTLIATGGNYGAGIGGGKKGNGENITIEGGCIWASGGESAAGIGGGDNRTGKNITIKGGIIIATGGKDGAGIGGGYTATGEYITIEGGLVLALGGDCAAGIGGGCRGDGKNITITGGLVTAVCTKSRGAGIGGGGAAGFFVTGGDGQKITISGGIVIAKGGMDGAGIGGGGSGLGFPGGDGMEITISGGMVVAVGGRSAAGIGGARKGNAEDIRIIGEATVYAYGGYNGGLGAGFGIGSGGDSDFAKKIRINTALITKAGKDENHVSVITNNGGDLAGTLCNERKRDSLSLKYVSVTPKQTNEIDIDVLTAAENWTDDEWEAIFRELADELEADSLDDIFAASDILFDYSIDKDEIDE